MSSEIYLAEVYWEDYINEEVVRIPLKAFESLPACEEFCDKCSEDTNRIKQELKDWWAEHKEEWEKICEHERQEIYKGNMKIIEKDQPGQIRKQEIDKKAKEIERSSEYHDLPIYEDMDITYESTPIDYEED